MNVRIVSNSSGHVTNNVVTFYYLFALLTSFQKNCSDPTRLSEIET